MSDKKYRLLKDFAEIKAGAIYEYNCWNDANGGGGFQACDNKTHFAMYPNQPFIPESFIKSNPDWFEEIKEENKSNDSFQWTDGLVGDYLAKFMTDALTSIDALQKGQRSPHIISMNEFKQSHTPKPQAENKQYTSLHELAEDRLIFGDKPQPQKEEQVKFNCPVHGISDKWDCYKESENRYVHNEKSKPQEQSTQRIEVEVLREYGSDMRHHVSDKGFYHPYTLRCYQSPIPKEKLPLIKQAIENILNNDDNGFWDKVQEVCDKEMEKFIAQSQNKYTQQQVDQLCKDAFNAAREVIEVKEPNGSIGYFITQKFTHQTFSDYKNSQSK